MKIGRVDGGVLVGRQLVHAYIKDQEQFMATAELARHSELLAMKLKIDPADAHRVVLAAWLSALDDKPDLINPLIEQYQLQHIIGSPELLTQVEGTHIGVQILSLLNAYESLKSRQPGIEKNITSLRKTLHELWAVTEERKMILNKFIRILRDEKFLLHTENPTATILIVDPDEVVSTVLTLPLSSQGYEVDAVGNVPAAEDALKEDMPDLIIADLELPIEDGITLCKKIREKPESREVPFIMLTRSRSQKVARNILKAGADDIIMRPIDMELFFIKVHKMLEGRSPVLTPEGIRGSLRDIALTDVIQMFCAGIKSVVVMLERDGEKGAIYIQEGEITEAKYGELSGEEAFYKLMNWKTGMFTAESCEDYPPRVLHEPAMSLLMEASRRSDEGLG